MVDSRKYLSAIDQQAVTLRNLDLHSSGIIRVAARKQKLALIVCGGLGEIKDSRKAIIKKIQIAAILKISNKNRVQQISNLYMGIDSYSDGVSRFSFFGVSNMDQDPEYEIILNQDRYYSQTQSILDAAENGNVIIRRHL